MGRCGEICGDVGRSQQLLLVADSSMTLATLLLLLALPLANWATLAATLALLLASWATLAATLALPLARWGTAASCRPRSPLHLPYISPISPLHLPYISPISPLHLPYISGGGQLPAAAHGHVARGGGGGPRAQPLRPAAGQA